MLNSPHNTVFAETDGRNEFIAPGSPLRLWMIGGLFSVAVLIILGRVAWIQKQLPDDYLDSLTATTTENEIIPARDGRILSDAVVLAADIEQYSLQLHYRWLQESADPDWLKLQTRQILSREERRDAQLISRTEQAILSRRHAMLQALCDITGIPPAELSARRRQVAERVERIAESVNQRHQSRTGSVEHHAGREDDLPGFLMQLASSIRQTLTTPPQRDTESRIVVREEESWHTVLSNVPVAVANQISEQPERFPGVRIIAETQRTYPEHDLAVHVVGARTQATADDLLPPLTSFGHDDEPRRVGRFGVEKSYQHRLTGVPGLRQIVRDRRQRIISEKVVRRPVSGRDVVLTLDAELQKVAEQLLAESLGDAEPELLRPQSTDRPGSEAEESSYSLPEPLEIATGGCVVVMEADSGRLVAAASAPDFDLTMFTSGTESQWRAVNSDTRRPFVSRFTGMALPPGSTFKILTALAGLQTGVLSPGDLFECGGYLNNPQEHRCLVFRLQGHGHGAVNLRSAMAQSCNVYFFDAARRMGAAPLTHWASLLQFGRATRIDLPFEKTGTLPVATAETSAATEAARRRLEREALGLAIGQSRLTVTPLQMARLLAFVANDGWIVTPHVVSDEGSARQINDIDDSPYRITRDRVPGVTGESLAALREGLVAAVEEPFGTAFKTVRLSGLRIAGKTGTAQTSPGQPDHAWFAGYVPADDPQYVMVVVLEHGGSGSRAAGPVARELARSLQQRGLLNSSHVTQASH